MKKVIIYFLLYIIGSSEITFYDVKDAYFIEYCKHMEEMYKIGERKEIRGTYKEVVLSDDCQAGERITGAPSKFIYENLKRKYDSLDRNVFVVS